MLYNLCCFCRTLWHPGSQPRLQRAPCISRAWVRRCRPLYQAMHHLPFCASCRIRCQTSSLVQRRSARTIRKVWDGSSRASTDSTRARILTASSPTPLWRSSWARLWATSMPANHECRRQKLPMGGSVAGVGVQMQSQAFFGRASDMLCSAFGGARSLCSMGRVL